MTTITIFNNRIELVPALAITGVVVAISLLGGLATDTKGIWYRTLRKPSWQPPAWLFGPVWTTIYLLLIISAVIIWNRTDEGERIAIMVLYAMNGLFNLAWSYIFFRGHTPLWAGVDIIAVWATVLLLMIRIWPISPVAALLLLPYLLWVTFASTINWAIVKMN